jgi:cytochrome c-type biogenesis protein CcmH/NrfG
MAIVRHLCGDCGADVRKTDIQCPSCGKRLEWDAKRGTGSHAQARRSKPANAEGAPGRRLEPWQIISIIAVGALVVYLVWTEMSRQQPSPVSTAAQPPMMQAPQIGQRGGVDTAPLEAAVAANPKDADAILSLANAYHDNGMLPMAIKQYRDYLDLHPQNPDARVDLGICYDQMAMTDSVRAGMFYAQAIKEMETALKSKPSHQPAAFNLGIVNLHRGDLAESNRWLKKAVAINKDSELGRRAQQILQQHSFTP